MHRFLPALLMLPAVAFAAGDLPTVGGIPVDFILFALTLLGVALFHNATLYVALTGLVTISLYKIVFTGFKTGVGVAGFVGHLGHEWVTIANLFCLLTGFALLARHFEKSHVPVVLPKFLPDDWKGGFVLLVMVFVISSFLDNIAAALIGGAMAHQLFKARVHIGYLAAIVAASNAGGSGSVVGDTTTTMMWIDSISPAMVDTMPSSITSRGPRLSISRPSVGLRIADTRKPNENAPAVTPRSQPNSPRIGGRNNENAVRALTPSAMVTNTTATTTQP